MRSSPNPKHFAAAAVVATLLGGCSAPPHVASPVVDTASLAEEVLAARATLADLGEARFAREARADLIQSESSLAGAEQAAADGDEQRAQLRLRVVKAQLAAIQSLYARREAETVLEDVRDGFVSDRSKIEALDRDNLRRLESPEDLP